jgi:hypothetical protein
MPPPIKPTQTHSFARISAGGDRDDISRDLAVETPVAIEVNGLG